MDTASTKAKIAVMQAYVEGEQIQARALNGAWHDVDIAGWDWGTWDYRVKPEPREWWLVMKPSAPHMFWYTTSKEASQATDHCTDRSVEVIHVREVLED
jgi:hypothetical protein